MHRSFYTQAFSRRSFYYTEKPLHELFPQKIFYTETLLSTEMLLCTGAFTHRRLYTQKLSHREALKHSIFYTDAIIHRNFYTRCFYTFLLGTVFLTQRSHYTEQLLHADALTVRRLYTEQLLAEGSAHGCLCTQELLHTSFYTHTSFT